MHRFGQRSRCRTQQQLHISDRTACSYLLIINAVIKLMENHSALDIPEGLERSFPFYMTLVETSGDPACSAVHSCSESTIRSTVASQGMIDFKENSSQYSLDCSGKFRFSSKNKRVSAKRICALRRISKQIKKEPLSLVIRETAK